MKDISPYLSSIQQSHYLEEKGFKTNNAFYYIKDEKGWFYTNDDPKEGQEFLRAYLLEEIKCFLPNHFSSGPVGFRQGSKELRAWICYCDPDKYPIVELISTSNVREMDAVFGMLKYLIEKKIIVANKPGIVQQPKKSIIIPLNG